MALDNDIQTTDRIDKLKLRTINTYSDGMSHQRKEIFQRIFDENPSDPQVLKMAKGLAAFLREKDIIFWDNDLLAGYEQYYDYSIPASPQWSNGNRSAADDSVIKQVNRGQRIGLYAGGLGGHVIAGYHRVLETGFGSLAEAARRKLEENDPASRNFALASLIVCEAATDYALRYAEKAQQMSLETADAEHKKQLERISNACQWVATNPARSFFEALQLLWLTHEIITCEQSSGSLSLGRLDQFLFPYYARDIADGLLTRQELGRRRLPAALEGDAYTRLLTRSDVMGDLVSDPLMVNPFHVDTRTVTEALPHLVGGLDIATARLTVAGLGIETSLHAGVGAP